MLVISTFIEWGGVCHGNLGGCIAPTQSQRSEIDVGMAPVGAGQRVRECKGTQVKGICKREYLWGKTSEICRGVSGSCDCH